MVNSQLESKSRLYLRICVDMYLSLQFKYRQNICSSIGITHQREVPASIPSQGPRHTKHVIKMVPVVPLFSTEHSKGKILALSQELR